MVDEQTRTVLAAGLAWIYDTVQPDDAVPEPEGYGAVVGDRRFWFVGSGRQGLPVIVMQVAHPVYTETAPYRLLNPLGDREVDALADALGALGHRVTRRWSESCSEETVSLGLAEPAHPSLRAAKDRYHTAYAAGCSEAVGAGIAKMVRPAWPACAQTVGVGLV